MVVLIIKIVNTALQMLSKQLKNYKQINRIKNCILYFRNIDYLRTIFLKYSSNVAT